METATVLKLGDAIKSDNLAKHSFWHASLIGVRGRRRRRAAK